MRVLFALILLLPDMLHSTSKAHFCENTLLFQNPIFALDDLLNPRGFPSCGVPKKKFDFVAPDIIAEHDVVVQFKSKKGKCFQVVLDAYGVLYNADSSLENILEESLLLGGAQNFFDQGELVKFL